MKIDLEKIGPVCNVTKSVIENFNTMSDQQFMNKYSCNKLKYFKRVIKYGDPYMKSPLAKIGKFLMKLQHK